MLIKISRLKIRTKSLCFVCIIWITFLIGVFHISFLFFWTWYQKNFYKLPGKTLQNIDTAQFAEEYTPTAHSSTSSTPTTIDYSKLQQDLYLKIRAARNALKGYKLPVQDAGLPPIASAYYDPLKNDVVALVFSSNLYFLHLHPLNARCLDKNYEELSDIEIGDFVFKYELIISCKGRASSANFVEIWLGDSSLNESANYTIVSVDHLPQQPLLQGQLAVCLAPIFGSFHFWLQLLQSVEWHKLVGAAHFFIYFQSSPDLISKKILNFYSEVEKVATIVQVSDRGECGYRHYCRHEFQLQECLYRARMSAFPYVATIDLDELLVPLKHEKLTDLLRQFDTSKSIGSFVFRNRWIIRYSNDPKSTILANGSTEDLLQQITEMALFSRWHVSTAFAPIGHTSKTVVKPETVKQMGVHHVREFRGNYTEFNIPNDFAYVRHYRNLLTWPNNSQTEAFGFGPTTTTDLDNRSALLLRNMKCTALKIKKLYFAGVANDSIRRYC